MSEQADGVLLLFTAKAKPGKDQELKDLFMSVITKSRHDAGNLFYELHETQDPGTIVLYEWWVSEEHLRSHMKTAPLAALKQRVEDLMEGKFEDGMMRLRRLRPTT